MNFGLHVAVHSVSGPSPVAHVIHPIAARRFPLVQFIFADDFFDLRDGGADGGAAFASEDGDEVQFVFAPQIDFTKGLADEARGEIDLDDLVAFADLEAVEDIG